MADEFFEIANNLVADEANDHLDKWLARVDVWAAAREAEGKPVDLRHLISQVLHEPNDKTPVLVALSAAMWRLREMKQHE